MQYIFNRKTSRELVDDLTYLNNLTDSMTVSNEMLDINIDNEFETLHDKYHEMLDTYERTKKMFKKLQNRNAKLQSRNAKLLGQINSINNKMR